MARRCSWALLLLLLVPASGIAADRAGSKLFEVGMGYAPGSDFGDRGGFAGTAGYVGPVNRPLSIMAGVAVFDFEHASFASVSVGPRIWFGRAAAAPSGPYAEMTAGLYRGDWDGASHVSPGFQATLGVCSPSLSGVMAELEATYTLTPDYLELANDFSPRFPGLEQGAVFFKVACDLDPNR